PKAPQKKSRLSICLAWTTVLVSAKLLSASSAEYSGSPYTGDDLFADSWVATDGAGRKAPGFAECGKVKPDKWVGIFYWTWHTGGRRSRCGDFRYHKSAAYFSRRIRGALPRIYPDAQGRDAHSSHRFSRAIRRSQAGYRPALA